VVTLLVLVAALVLLLLPPLQEAISGILTVRKELGLSRHLGRGNLPQAST